MTAPILLLAVATLLLPSPTARARLAAVGPGSPPASGDNGRRNPERGRSSSLAAFPEPLLKVGAPVLALLVLVLLVCSAASLGTGAVGMLSLLVATGCVLAHRCAAVRKAPRSTDPLRLAACWDLLAASLRAGLAVPVAARSVADELTGPAGDALRKVADLLALGADPVSAWEPALGHPDTAELARAACRTARTGSGLAAVAADLATRTRAVADQHAQERAQRAAVWVTAPLGTCFLPAFLCLGIVPVLAGMIGQLTFAW